MTNRRSRLIPAALVAAVALLLASCRVATVVGPAEDDLAGWSAEPLAPDANLANVALGQSACRAGPGQGAGAIQLLVQDRRTEQTAAFLVRGPDFFGSCIVTAGAESSSATGPVLAPMSGPMSIDDNGFGDVSGRTIRELGGRVAPNAMRVVIELSDGRSVIASVANGFWLAWWPGEAVGDRVVAYDAQNVELARLEVPE